MTDPSPRELPPRARAFVRHYFDGKALPVQLGKLGQLLAVAPGRSHRRPGHPAVGRIELRVQPRGRAPFVVYAEPRSDSPHLAATGALNLSYIAEDGPRPDERALSAVTRALAGYFEAVERSRGRPDRDAVFGPPGDPLELAANDYRVRARRIEAIVFPTDACNLRCTYCVVPFGRNTLTEPRIDRIFELLRAAEPDHVAVTFLGGEPMLHWPTVESVSERLAAWWDKPPLCIVTNATFLEDKHAAFFKRHDFNVTVSIDGDEQAHTEHRLDVAGDRGEQTARLYRKTLAGLDRLLAVQADVQANMVVTPATVGRLAEGSSWLMDRGVPLVTVSPAVGVPWPKAAREELALQLAGWRADLVGRIRAMPRERRAVFRGVMQWELRRSWYFLGRSGFNPTTRRLCFAPDGRIFSDLYNDDTAEALQLGHIDDIGSLLELPESELTVPQAMFHVREWPEPVLKDVEITSVLLLNELIELERRAFDDEPGSAELLGHLPTEPEPLPDDAEATP